MTRMATFAVSLAVVFVSVVGSLADRPDPVQHHRTVPLSASPIHIAVVGDSYTTGSDEGGRGAAGWTELAWQILAGRGLHIRADVAAEGGAGYGIRGNRGGLFRDLAPRAVQSDDALVVFFGSRNDQDVDPGELTSMIAETLSLARLITPSARLLVIGPPWPTSDVPGNVLRIRDILNGQAHAAGAEFVDPLAEGWFVGRPDLIGADGVHPTDAGHAYMADKIAPLVGAQLPKLA
ncbi:MAG: GDSL lipase [Mycobacterium sp.]